MVYKTLNFSEVWQSYDNFIKLKLNTYTFFLLVSQTRAVKRRNSAIFKMTLDPIWVYLAGNYEL